jgi:hypothetical protein
MGRHAALAIGLAWCLLSASGAGCQDTRGGAPAPSEYRQQGAVLTLTRADMRFASDDIGDGPREGTFVYSLGGILGGEKTFWLLRDGLWEYDLQGNQLGVIPFPEPNKLGWAESFLATAEGIYILQNRGWNWRSDRPNETRLSYELFSFAESKWLGPIRIPDVVAFAHTMSTIELTVRGGEVLIVDTYKGLGVPISSGGKHCDPVVHGGPRDLGSRTIPVDAAANGSGLVLVCKGGKDHFDEDRGVVIEHIDYDIVDGAGVVVGSLRDQFPPPAERRPCREDTPLLSWAILADGTVLQLEISIYGEPDDAIRVIRWAP